MGRGDKRSKKSKITIGSYGVSRPIPSALAKDKSKAETKPKLKKAPEASNVAAAPKVKKS